jgi:hypothetical protein
MRHILLLALALQATSTMRGRRAPFPQVSMQDLLILHNEVAAAVAHGTDDFLLQLQAETR